ADLTEERHRFGDRKATQHTSNDRPTSSPEIGVGHACVRDVAARPAADQDLRAELTRAVQQDDGCRWMKASGKNCGREAGGAAADYRDITSERREPQAPSVRALAGLSSVRDRPARVAADDVRVRVGLADDLGPVAAAFRTDRRSFRTSQRADAVSEVDHSVV